MRKDTLLTVRKCSEGILVNYLLSYIFLTLNTTISPRTSFLPHETDNVILALEQMAQHEIKGVVLVSLNHIAYHNKFNSKLGIIYAMIDPVATYSVAVHYPRNSPLVDIFDRIFLQLQATGIVNYWANKYGDYAFLAMKLDNPAEPTPLGNNHLAGLYIIFSISMFIATVVFIGEILSAQLRELFYRKFCL